LEEDVAKFNTIEHIVPESIGGGDWAILGTGLFCDKCQNTFGSTIEQQALADYPFSVMRTMLHIPTKKRKEAWFNNSKYKVFGSNTPNLIGLEITDKDLQKAAASGQIKTLKIPAFTKRPDMLLRTLLKIGIEVLAGTNPDFVFDSRFDPARIYALTGTKQYPWWFFQYENMNLFDRYFAKESWEDQHCFMYISTHESGFLYLHMRLFFYSFFVPLYANVILDKGYLPNEPYERVITVD